MNAYTLLHSPIERPLRQLLTGCERNLFVASPFINDYGVGVLIDALANRIRSVSIEILTSVNPRSLTDGGLDLTALIRLCQEQSLVGIRSLPQLHAKVYVVDERKAIIGSANLTRGGLRENHEYGIAVSDTRLVAGIAADTRAYANLGSLFTHETLEQLAGMTRQLQAAQKRAERAQRLGDAGRQLRRQVRDIENALLRSRVRERAITAIFADTIRYLLRSGPMSTEALHSRIKSIHSDICDDSIDRVIDGQRFGRLWKHHVRNAQQFLKRRGEIVLSNGRWQSTDDS